MCLQSVRQRISYPHEVAVSVVLTEHVPLIDKSLKLEASLPLSLPISPANLVLLGVGMEFCRAL